MHPLLSTHHICPASLATRVFVNLLTGEVLVTRDINRGVSLEEIRGSKMDAMNLNRHDRPVLVMKSAFVRLY